MEHPKLDEWLRRSDEVLKEESIILDGLKKAVGGGWMTEEELETNIEAYHRSRNETDISSAAICPDVEGRDI